MQNFELQFELGNKCFRFYQEILRLTDNKHGYCFKKNAPFCAEYGVTERTIQRWLKKLSDLGLIRVELIKNKYRQIFATNLSSKCRPNVGVNNKQVTNKSIRDKENDNKATINDLKEKHGEDLVDAALKVAEKNSKYDYIAYLKTLLANGFKPQVKKSPFKQPKKVIRKEMTPDWLKPNENGVMTTQPYQKRELTTDDLATIERMKQLQEQILKGIKH